MTRPLRVCGRSCHSFVAFVFCSLLAASYTDSACGQQEQEQEQEQAQNAPLAPEKAEAPAESNDDPQPAEAAGDPAAGPAAEPSAELASKPSQSLPADAQAHFSRGSKLFQASSPDYQSAYQQFLLAYRKSGGNWRVLAHLALSAKRLERDREAVEYYQAYLDEAGERIRPAERRAIQEELELIESNMATVKLRTKDTKTAVPVVTVQRRGSSVPPQDYPLERGAAELGVRAGTLTFTVRAGSRTRSWTATLDPLETATHTFDFATETNLESLPRQPSGPAASIPPDTRETSPLTVTGYAVGGLGLTALLGGTLTGLMTQSRDDQARAAADRTCINGVCPESLESEFEEAKKLARTTNALFVVGGLLSATGIALIWVGSSQGAEKTASTSPGETMMSLSPLVTPSTAGLLAAGSFSAF